MKLFPGVAVRVLVFLLAISASLAQEAPPLPKQDDGADASASASPEPTPQLIPADILPAPLPGAVPRPHLSTIPELDASLLPKPLSPAADAYRHHLEWRRLRNQMQNDAEVKAAFTLANAAPTDLEKRKLLTNYYDVLYAKMIARAPAEMKPFLADRKREAVGALPQPRVRPTPASAKSSVTIGPLSAAAPTPSPSPRLTPAPAGFLPSISGDRHP